MKALTVRQPWAWALIHGGKDIENRSRNLFGVHRGDVAIHASLTIDRAALEDPLIGDAWHDAYGWDIRNGGLLETGRILGVVEATGAHYSIDGCCDSPWAERSYTRAGGSQRVDPVHLEVANPRSIGFAQPIYCRGRLGLWELPRPYADLVDEALATRERIRAGGNDA